MARPNKLPSQEDESFGARLMRYRTSRGYSRNELASDLTKAIGQNVSPRTIKGWETEGKIPKGEFYAVLKQRIVRSGF